MITTMIPITNSDEGQGVDARQLHKFLGTKTVFNHWIKRRIEKYNFIEGEDYIVLMPDLALNAKGRPTRICLVTLDMAKQLCMVEDNEQGIRARKYYIECEKRLKSGVMITPAFNIPQTKAGALRLAADLAEDNERLESEQRLLKAKITADKGTFDIAANRLGYISLGDAASIISNPKYGKRNIFTFLADQKILNYKGFEDKKYDIFATHKKFFKLHPTHQTGGHGGRSYMQVKINLRGIMYIIKRMHKVSGGWNALPNEAEVINAFIAVDAQEHLSDETHIVGWDD